MKLIVGLGNPGLRYKNSRHNIGIRVIKDLAKKFRVKLKKENDTFSKKVIVKNKRLDFILAHPLLFMNLSGESIRLLLKKYKISQNNFLVVHDDLDLGLGKIRIRAKGSSAGHKGLKSIIANLGTDEFARLRIGIGRAEKKEQITDFVLGSFTGCQERILKGALSEAVDCSLTWLFEGTVEAMDRFN